MIGRNVQLLPFLLCVATGFGSWVVCGPSIQAAEAGIVESPLSNSDRDYWSFQALRRPVLPDVTSGDWPLNAIDRFILAKLEKNSIQPSPRADKHTLIRRLYLDVLGVLPTQVAIDSFLQDQQPDAYGRLVDRVLASPRYGERWAQHWLDLARFAETDGFEHDKTRPDAWKYRDWVIRALNQDMPYDDFVRLQVAGDLYDPSHSIATAFCLSGPDMPDINSQVERKQVLLTEMTSTVGAVILGLQVGCAQCHDHMFDPISQADFYRLRAFFEPAVHVKRNRPVSTLLDANQQNPTSHLLRRGDWRSPGPAVEPAFPRIANPTKRRPDRSHSADSRRDLAEWLVSPHQPLTARVIANRLWQHHFGSGLSTTPSDFGLMGDYPSHPRLLDWLATELMRNQWRLKNLHRLLLTSATYQQTSRTSSTITSADEVPAQTDDRLLWHFPHHRLDAETIRDAMLSASGLLDLRMTGPGVRPPLPPELVGTLLKNQWIVSKRRADHFRRSIYLFARRNLRYPMFATFDRPIANSSCAKRQRSTTANQSLLLMNSTIVHQAAEALALQIFQAGDNPRTHVRVAINRVYNRPVRDQEARMLLNFLAAQQQRILQSKAIRTSAERIGVDAAAKAGFDPAANYHEALKDLCLALFASNEFLYLQ